MRFAAHSAPAASVHACCAIEPLAHLEWFGDHVRIEPLLFDGVPEPDAAPSPPTAVGPGWDRAPASLAGAPALVGLGLLLANAVAWWSARDKPFA